MRVEALLAQRARIDAAGRDAETTEALGEWLGTRPELVQLAPHQLHDVWQDLESIGEAIGRSDQARRLRHALADGLTNIVESLGALPQRPRVACVEWLDPLMIAGHWIPELVRIAGGEPLLSHTGAASRTIDCDTDLIASTHSSGPIGARRSIDSAHVPSWWGEPSRALPVPRSDDSKP